MGRVSEISRSHDKIINHRRTCRSIARSRRRYSGITELRSGQEEREETICTISQTPDLFWLIVVCLLAASFFLLVFGLTGIKACTKIVEIPKGILMPTILILSVIGAFAIRNSVYDILWMFGFGIIGYFLKRFNYPIAPIVLGVILSRLCEENYRRGVMLEGSISGMLWSIFTSYIFVLLVVLFITQTEAYRKWKARRKSRLH